VTCKNQSRNNSQPQSYGTQGSAWLVAGHFLCGGWELLAVFDHFCCCVIFVTPFTVLLFSNCVQLNALVDAEAKQLYKNRK